MSDFTGHPTKTIPTGKDHQHALQTWNRAAGQDVNLQLAVLIPKIAQLPLYRVT